MKIHPVVQHLNNIVTVTLQPSFVGDVTDASDRQRIAAYGDPIVNMSGTFTDSVSMQTFTFSVAGSTYNVGITTALSSSPVRFMSALPVALPGQPAVVQGTLDCITGSTVTPVNAATAWAAEMDTRILAAMTSLRAITPAQLTQLPDATA